MLTLDPQTIAFSAKSGDLHYPYALWMPLKEDAVQPKIKSRMLILHSEAGPTTATLENLFAYTNLDSVHIEPTFILDMDGRMAQLVRINVRADCNAHANDFSTSVETQDKGSATLASTPWTQEQTEQLAGLAAWMHMHPDIQLELVLLAKPEPWDGKGINGHRTYPEWSIYVGKTCPGDARYAQIPGIIERAKEIVKLGEAPVVPVPVPPVNSGDMDPILIRFFGTTNVFLSSDAGYKHLNPEEVNRASVKLGQPLVIKQHKQCMQRCAGENFFEAGDWYPYAPERTDPEQVKFA